jgi:vacuolar-type H+-ATPase subunit F/Vma7
VAETLAPFLSDSQKYEKETYPIILFLPMEGKESGLGLEQLKKDVEKAIGIALLR